MVRRNVIIGLFGMLAACMVTFGVVGRAYAQDAAADPDNTVPTGSKNNPWTIRYTQEEFNAYNDAIAETGCSTPSLECLVRNTTRFVAIEWVQEIMGPNFTVNFENGTEVPPPPTTLNPNQRNTGIIASTFGLIGQMYAYQPATTGRYVAYVLDTADLAPPAYAQGIGFAALDPILDLWKMFRNVAYFFFIGVFIVIGFMIMFRQKISGQAAITAQQAIPSIIISLILVTFSYAISGFLIDLMYLFMFMLVYLFNFASGSGSTVSTDAITWSIFELAGNLIGSQLSQAIDPNSNNNNLVREIVDNIGALGQNNAATQFMGFMGGLTLSLIMAVAVLFGMVKLFFELLKSYASIIMGVIFAPFYLMMGAIPGKNTFAPWLKNMIGNLAAFPTVLLFVMLYSVFTSNVPEGGGGFMPPYLIGGGQSNVAGYLLGLAIILALPEIVKEIKKKMGASESGFGWMMAGAAAKSFRNAEVAIPIATAAAPMIPGGAMGVRTAWKQQKRRPMQLASAFFRGSAQPGKGIRGGAFNYAGKGWNVGKQARITLDRLQEGKLFEAQDTDALLATLAGKNKTPAARPRVSVPRRANPQTPPGHS